jgi:membrane-associated phospholipid phosphatase
VNPVTAQRAPTSRSAAPSPAAIVRAYRQVRQRFQEGRARVGDAGWRKWWYTIGIGTIGMGVLMVALVRITQRLVERGSLEREPDFLLWLAANGPFSFSTAVFFQAFGTDITLGILIILTAGIAAWNRRSLTALSLISGWVVVDVVVRFGWLIWARARPYILHGGVPGPAFHAFPSGHTGKTFAVYGLLTFLWLRASQSIVERAVALILFFFVAVVVPIGRLSMGVHWPSDVMAGFVIGAVWLGVLVYARRYEAIAVQR